MEPWSFGSDGIGKALFFSDEMDLPIDAFARSGNPLMEWETKPIYRFGSIGLVSDSVAAEGVEFMDLGSTDITRNHFPYNQALGEYGREVGSDSSKASPTYVLTPNSSFGEVESGLSLSSSIMECNSHDDSSLVDLKLGRLADCDGANCKSTKGVSVLASGGSAVVANKAHTTSSYSRAPVCQVQGCKVDLISSRDYYKKHKVCDAHSKTARVIVNGIEQRFCQQCSRFHLLTEFDGGKRSCRKRLAYHNERRRKSQSDSFYGKPHKLLQSTRETSSAKRSPFVLYPEKYGEANRIPCLKFEKECIFSPQLEAPMMNRQLHAKSYPHLYDIGQQHCSGVQELSGTPNSSCALSLLSTQSKDLSSYSAAIYMGGTLFYPGEHATDQISEGIARVKGKYAANEFYSSTTNPFDADQMGSIMLPDGIVRGSGFTGSQHWFSPEHGTTVDLLQLSSHLQRVEQQRSSLV